MARRRWQRKEFTKKTDMGIGLARESLAREMMEFLDAENLAPEDCCISWHTEPAGKDEDETVIVAQVFYRK